MKILIDAQNVINGSRIPLEYRTNKDAAITFVSAVELLDVDVTAHADVCALMKWTGLLTDAPAFIESIEALPDTQTYDLSVPDGHSYVANGIVCHNTTNIPEETPIDVTKTIYMRGWELGCKGVTIYRDGSRSGVLVKKESAFKQHSAPKRPKELQCKIHHANIKNETWTILVGLLDGKPYEVFGGLSRYVEIPKKYDEGILIKNEKKSTGSTYDLKIGNDSDLVIKNVVEQFDNPNYAVMTRIISLALRHGANIQYVVEQLQKGEKDADMFSFSKVIARVLKPYIEDGSKTTLVKHCPQCDGTKFAYQENCPKCLDCGWSKCQ